MKIAIIGGHLTPALSVIEALPKDAKVLYIGRKYALEGDKAVSLEYETITKKGIPFSEIKTGRLQRRVSRHTLPSLVKVPYGLTQALLTLKKFKPDVVVGFGGYVSFPVIIVAKILHIPVVIHEQTLEVGFTNKMLSKFADKICISFSSSAKYFPKEKVVLSGNPIRKAIFRPAKIFKIESGDPVIFITGGSIGSHFINLMVSSVLARLLDKYSLVHQVGNAEEFKDFEKLSILKEGLNSNKREKYILSKFFSPEEMGSIMKAASLVVARAGVNTISELIVLRKPSYLIPLPRSQKNEQLKNAYFLKELGLGEIGEQKSLTPERFLTDIRAMMQNLGKYKLKSSESHFPKNAASKIVEVIYAARKDNN
ncbi:MAG: UDP-N-acetylglucosamine--N-acetylmuramyl-(pentapeptide) pyrophosphoryl-undecaprenol N-acetylglucosamine transferase [Candidatus Levybacteria bacterium]|nr:UDP-N-acetylglucosamine--N-acetylmuramyl-(pentapeptide) pyrophosphoryl-undecaprenol N-acetylglucosamine transferase [Candidatus Levybacteria bacterium]